VNGTNGALYATADDLKSAVRLPANAVKTNASAGKTQVAPRACFALFLGEVCSLEKYWKADVCPPAPSFRSYILRS